MTYSDEEWLGSLRKCDEIHGEVTPTTFDEDDRFPSYTGAVNRFGSWTRAKELAGVGETHTVECKGCEKRFAHIGKHWNNSSCRWPTLSSTQLELLTGVLMGDGTLLRDGTNCCIAIEMANREYLQWLDQRLKPFSTGVKLKHSASEQLERAKDAPLKPIRNSTALQPSYLLVTRRSPQLNRFRSWYDTEQKRYPSNLSLTPAMFQQWYCGDGTLNIREKATNPRATIVCKNEQDRAEFITNLFQDVGFEPTHRNGRFVFNVEDTSRLLEWAGKAPPGFEYKWAETYKAYTELKPS
ncbi:homing endonuclease associated repeat-containing protein [Halosimplex halobium]|uniref:homing endonuclease associated repeat-containing protein n=1 Tax=Halosimplex halobium TaxID=3396618 RepID=UPI003F573EB3